MEQKPVLYNCLGLNTTIPPESTQTEQGVFLTECMNVVASNGIVESYNRSLVSFITATVSDFHVSPTNIFVYTGSGITIYNKAGNIVKTIATSFKPIFVDVAYNTYIISPNGAYLFYNNEFFTVDTQDFLSLYHTDRVIQGIPTDCHLACYFSGRLLVAVGSNIYMSIPYNVTKFNLSEGRRSFTSRLTYIGTTGSKLWVSDSFATYMVTDRFSSKEPDLIKMLDVPIVPGKYAFYAKCPFVADGNFLSALFVVTSKGLYALTDEGFTLNLSENRVKFSDSNNLPLNITYATTSVIDDNLLITLS